jgi:PUA domain protein
MTRNSERRWLFLVNLQSTSNNALEVPERVVMPTKHRRYALKSKQAKQILNEISERLKVNVDSLFGAEANVEVVEADIVNVYLVDGKPLFFKVGDSVLPTLLFQDFTSHAPKIVVDMGAVPYVCNGADIMAPGIVRVEGEFGEGDVVLVVDEKHGKSLAVGESLYDAVSVRNTKQGAVVKNIHFVSDKIWNFAKTLVG